MVKAPIGGWTSNLGTLFNTGSNSTAADANDPGSGVLTRGAVAGIVIGCAAVAGIMLFAGVRACMQKRSKSPPAPEPIAELSGKTMLGELDGGSGKGHLQRAEAYESAHFSQLYERPRSPAELEGAYVPPSKSSSGGDISRA